ncbi:MAG TPA: hypothetical protein VJ812_10940 [Gemmatimonadaceae bacterium]|jgi:hypothetical protein|nr:hypothetical protein [Gemmatimonadaceae bacterium]
MPRALTFQRTVVTPSERKKYFERLRARRAYYTGVSCRFWVFEEVGLAGAFIEFIEANEPDVLSAALGGAPDQVVEAARIYREVELD